jgi:photosystem II stability/assembly factor-like uncharacterized protein
MKTSLSRLVALAAPALLLALGTSSAWASGNPPPPKGFEADSVSFVSAQTGFVLGARGCSRMPCRVLLERTTDGGTNWAKVATPAVRLVMPFTTDSRFAVSTVRFENARDGWLFGPGLWATTDGGAQWTQESMPGKVIALAASDGVVFASVQPAKGGPDAARLYQSTVGGTGWTLDSGVSPQAALAVSGHSVWAGIPGNPESGPKPSLWTSRDGGQHWSALSFHCPKVARSASPLAASSPEDVVMVCSDSGYPQPGSSVKEVFTSANGGRTFQLAGKPPEPGEVYGLATPPGQPQVITLDAASGASFLYQSTDGGATWQTTTYDDGGLSFRDLAYVSATTGYVIHFNGGPVIAYTQGLMETTNDGATWQNVTVR